MNVYAKSAMAVLVTIISAITAALTDNTIDVTEWINVAIAGAGAAAVFAAPNVPGSLYTKAVLAVLTAVLTALVSYVSSGLSMAEIMQLVVVGLGALGVYAVPNRPAPAPVES
jgi:hypothetical protein